jgi:hypothetical protein
MPAWENPRSVKTCRAASSRARRVFGVRPHCHAPFACWFVGLTYSTANSLAKYGVTVNAVSPGAATRMTESVPGDRRRARTESADERSPDNVAPLVAYLASERSGWITGRVVHAAGYEVALYNNPQPVIRLIGTEPWPLDALAAQIERAFGPMLGRPGS